MMHLGKTIKWLIVAGLLLVAVISSSWFGALLWVNSFPGIIKYLGTPQILDTTGHAITTAKPGQWVIFRSDVQRQPLRCWGEYVYVLVGDQTNYQMPMVRSYGLTNSTQQFVAKNLFQIPGDIPPGKYSWDVVVFPHCDGVEMSPATYSLGVSTNILPKD